MSKQNPPKVELVKSDKTTSTGQDNHPAGKSSRRFGADGGLSPRLFQEAVEQASSAISITDEHANILYANPAFERISGYTTSEALGHNESMLSSKHTPLLVYETLWSRITSGFAWNGILLNQRKDGGDYVADLTISPVVNAAGEITNYLGIHRDISDLYQLEHEVLNQKKLIETVLDAEPMVVAVLTPARKVLLDNLSYKKLITDLGEEPAGALLREVAMGDEAGFDARWQKRQSFHGVEVRFETRSRGSRWFSCSGIWFHQKDASTEYFFNTQQNDFMLLVASEVTDYKLQQEALRTSAMRALIAEQEHEDSMREALSAAIFQLQGPLNLIGAAYGMLSRKPELGPELKPLANVLQEALSKGKGAMDMLRNCMPDTLVESRSSVNINEVLRDVLSIFTERMLAAGVTVVWQPQRNLPSVNGQPARLRGMFKQLVENAIDALYTSHQPLRELRLMTRAVDSTVEIIIEDTGVGIAPELTLKAFEPFFTTKGAHVNAGMGLTLVQAVVTDHSGSVELTQGENGGCRVAIVLPLRHAHTVEAGDEQT